MLHTDRAVDILVYGATGFTGKLVCAHLKARYLDSPLPEDSITMAIGGRSKEKLEKVKAELGLPSTVQIFVVDSSDAGGLRDVCQQTKAVITLVGPYALHGDALISACAENGTHYFDLTGETLWASRQISKLSDKAKESKAIIISSCGFDSVPSDLSTMIAARELKQITGNDSSLGRVTSGFQAQGGVSGGTVASMLNMYDEGIVALRRVMSCYLLSPIKGPQEWTGEWITREQSLTGGFFVMAPHNGAIVRRSWGLLESSPEIVPQKARYGPKFTYDEYMITKGPVTAFLLTLTFRILGVVLLLPQLRQLVKRYGPQSGDGPSKKTRDSGWFKLISTAHSAEDDVQVRVTMRGTKDPGYGWTSVCIAECAVTVIKSHDQLPPLARYGGFLTPATGLGDALCRRLESAKMIKIDTEVLKNEKKKQN
ncbi:hypothetical protein CROQUDRAFT_650567 [Cronartium quercuum f. sp. fusiforme G11]|uniref:Saccharopine dehydrogenase NADP binding domain-containing protein n=1 Tax=Cronartium quercuum f. sp. fusiforme G11 TaxID=708437 RepID=A0A9P6TH00_9BASI|nr:hypothetical protein CROQUDRAFT_650567 [Cronartium quercuum f. sp. fusiforme G11]